MSGLAEGEEAHCIITWEGFVYPAGENYDLILK